MKTSTKERIIETIKFILFTTTSTIGIWFTLTFTWFCLGLPQTGWVVWLLFVIASVLDWLFIKWLNN